MAKSTRYVSDPTQLGNRLMPPLIPRDRRRRGGVGRSWRKFSIFPALLMSTKLRHLRVPHTQGQGKLSENLLVNGLVADVQVQRL